MTPLVPFALIWFVGAALLIADGRRPYAIGVALTTFAAVFVGDVFLLVEQMRGAPVYEAVTGGWPAGIGIRLHADRMALLFAAVVTLVLGGVLVHEARSGIVSRPFPALLLLLGAGLHGAFLTGDLFNFYVFFELSIVASFGLAAYGYGKAEIRATFIYVAINLFGSVLFLTGIAVLYQARGTLDLEQLAAPTIESERVPAMLAGALVFSALVLKLGLFPFHGWVPVLYSHARPAVAAAMSGALVNLGAYGLLRIGWTALADVRASAGGLLVALGLVAVLYGALLAIRRRRAEEVAAYAAIAHAGYVVLAIGVAGEAGVAAALLVVVSGSIDKAAMFLALETGPAARDLVALVSAGSAAGLPPTAGFIAKVLLFRATLQAPAPGLATAVFVVASVLSLAAALRFIRVAARAVPNPRAVGAVPLVLAGLSLAVGIWPEPVVRLATEIANELIGGAR